MAVPIDRRELLKKAFLEGSGLLLLGCASPRRVPTVTPEMRQVPTDYKKRTVMEISALPDSLVKRALVARVVPLLEAKPPFNLTVSGVDIPVHNMTVDESLVTSEVTRVDATYNSRKTIPTGYHPVSNFATKIPGIGILKPSEWDQVPTDTRLPDGTWFLNFNGTPVGFIGKSIHPHISVTVGWNGNPNRLNVLQPLRTLGYIKEACSFLLDILRMEATLEKMKQFNLPTHIDARDPGGKVENFCILPEAFVAIGQQSGRSQALLDIAGYVISLRALATTSGYQTMIEAGVIDQNMVSLLAQADLGSTDRDLFLKSYEWALNTPEAQTFPHVGDMNKIP